jgi:hypothetical protein
VINRRLRNNRWPVVVAACATLAAGASFAEERAGKADEAAPSGRPSDSGGPAKNAGTGGRNSGLVGNRGVAGGATLRAPTEGRAASGRPAGEGGFGSRGTASGGTPGGIDLIRPDDGYASLRHRAARSSPTFAGQKKSPPIVSTMTVAPHRRYPTAALGEPVRNSTGVLITRKPDTIQPVPSAPGGIGISKTHIIATAPVTGINGTNMGHARASGVGGPKMDLSGINGSAFHHK